MSNAIKIGAEILVNTMTDNDQYLPAIAALPGGGFVAAWTDWSQSDDDPNLSAIRAQRFDVDGNKVGGEFLVNSTILDNQTQPAVTALSDGRFVIAWVDGSERSDTRGDVVRAQVYEADGDPSGAELTISSATAGYQENPTLAALSDGRFVAIWQEMSGMSFTIWARIWNADGTPSGNDFLVDATITGLQDFPAVTVLSDGRFVVAWEDWSTTGGDTVLGSIRAQIFDPNGVRSGADLLVNTHISGSQSRPAITSLTDGRFVVTWEDSEGDSSGFAIRAQIFEASGHPDGDEFIVNTVTDSWQWRAKIAALPGGGFVATWGSDTDDPSTTSWELHAQVFDADGEKSGDELTVGALSETPLMTTHAVTVLSNGRFVVNWQTASSTGGDTDGNSVHAQIFGFGNGAPVITSNGGGDSALLPFDENTTAVTTVTASDPNGATLSYAIVGGADAAKFHINVATGALSFVSAPNFEAPQDDGGNNSYEVIVAASDGTLTDTQTITVNVADVNEAPVITSNGGGESAMLSIAETTSAVTTVAAVDPDGDAHSYSIIGGADAALFRINGTGVLSFVSAPDFEAPADADGDNSYVVTVRTSDGNLFDEQTITVNVTDVAAPAEFGGEILVNTTTAGGQFEPTITGLANGRFVVAWTDEGGSPDDSYGAVRGQVFNADGTKAGGEFRVNTTTLDYQSEPTTTALTDGRFVVAWTDDSESGGDTSRTAVRAQVFNADGTPLGSELLINAITDNYQNVPSITALSGGRFLVAWSDYSESEGDTNGGAVRARIFNVDGNPSGGDLLVNTSTNGIQHGPTATTLADGTFVVAWTDMDATRSDASVRMQLFRTDGTPRGSELLINTTTDGYQDTPCITALADGRFVVAWSDSSESGGDTSDYAVRARIFNADGSESVAEFLVNTATYSYQWLPQITALRDGRFVASWVDNSSGMEIVRAQVFETDGTKSGDEFVAAAPDGNPVEHAITALADGRFVIAWSGDYIDGGDTDQSSIHAQIFDPREGPVNLVGTPLDDDLVGTRFNDTITGLGGNDRLDGGAGEDTAVFSQSRDKYTVIEAGDMIAVQGPDGTDVLFNFEHLKFAEGGPTPPPIGEISGLFDTRYYLSLYTDVFDAKVGALDHYNTFGWHEGRDPNAWFDTTGYFAANPGVAASGLNPLDHYHQIGWREGRDPSANFDTTLYLLHNPDVAAAGIDPLEHYMQHGMAEGRAIYQAVGQNIAGGFDAEYYLFHNPDVAAAGVDPLFHYNVVGWQEGRDPNAWFDSDGYLAHYTDVAAAGINPLQHYEMIGWKEGRDASARFDTAGYLAANPDVAAAGMNPLDHFLQFGIYEGRQAVNDGVWG